MKLPCSFLIPMDKEDIKYTTLMIKSGDDNQETVLNRIKNEILAAVYDKDFDKVHNGLAQVLSHLKETPVIRENDEKTARQVLVLLNHHLPKPENPRYSLLQQPLSELKTLLVDTVKTKRPETNVEFKAWKERTGLTDRQFDLIFKTAMTFQLTVGCSHFCRRCNEWALPGVRAHFSYSAVLEILDQLLLLKNTEISLYGASDPLDWIDQDKTIVDIVQHLQTLPIEYSLLSKVPKGTRVILKSLVESNANLSVSVTGKNKGRIEKIESEVNGPVYKQHDSDDLLIPAGLDEDFNSVKPSITDGYGTEITPDGAFIIIPTFTSGLNPFGHQKIPITKETRFFPKKMTGRHGLLVDYFKPLKGYDLEQNPVCLDHLLDVQVESILLDTGEDHLTPPGMTSFREYFFIFNETARIRRKNMTPSVLSRLKKEFPEKGPIFQIKFQRHQEMCKQNFCMLYKMSALSFFFNAICCFLKTQPVKKRIIKRLLNPYILNWKNKPPADKNNSVKDNFKIKDIDDFELFRFYVYELIDQPENKKIERFIKTFPAMYDPLTDTFINKPK